MMYEYRDIKAVHLELTERCNLACYQCDRNINGTKDNPYIRNTSLSLFDISKIFPVSFVQQLHRLVACGNYGDPIMAPQCLEIFRYFRAHNPNLWLSINTNASANSPEWWAKLARVIGRNGNVVFSIDGLADTNHLYRQGARWNKIIENLKAFIEAGGRARWDFIVFGHNEHQVDEAREYAYSIGCEKFIVKKSGRFFSNIKKETKEVHTAKTRKGKEVVLEKPNNEKFQNNALSKEELLVKKYGSMQNYYDSAKIECKVQKEKSVYVTAEGLILPCCWIGSQMYKWYMKPKEAQVWDIIGRDSEKDNLSALTHSIEEIVSSNFFQNDVPGSWNKSSCKEGKLDICSAKCGTEFDPFGEQFK